MSTVSILLITTWLCILVWGIPKILRTHIAKEDSNWNLKKQEDEALKSLWKQRGRETHQKIVRDRK